MYKNKRLIFKKIGAIKHKFEDNKYAAQSLIALTIIILLSLTLSIYLLLDNDIKSIIYFIFAIFLLFLSPKVIQNDLKRGARERKMFGNLLINLDATDNNLFKIVIYIYNITVLISIIFVFIAPAIAIYYFNFHENEISKNTAHWGQFGDYVGGVVGTILALLAFLATLYIIYQQGKQINIDKNLGAVLD